VPGMHGIGLVLARSASEAGTPEFDQHAVVDLSRGDG
jgi:hypothetical protein